jgi:hypothetical protein
MKMKLIDKLNSIDKPKIEQLPQGKATSLSKDLLKTSARNGVIRAYGK